MSTGLEEQFPLDGITPIPCSHKPINKTTLIRYERILAFIASSIKLRGCAPNVREVALFMKYRSPASAVEHLKNMIALGLIERTGEGRSSVLTIPEGEELTDLQKHSLLVMKNKGVTIYQILKVWKEL